MPGWAEALLDRPERVAATLLGAVLRHETEAGAVAVRLTEVEAYAGADDPGSHAARGRTPRNAAMFGEPGRLYVYFTYGMHVCANVVVGPAGTPGAVLLRAGEVVDGVDLARSRRGGGATAPRDRDLARGPARLCRALGVDLSHDGAPIGAEAGAGGLVLLPAAAAAGTLVRTGPRVGLRLAPERPWRFWLDGEPTVSAYRPAAPRRPRP